MKKKLTVSDLFAYSQVETRNGVISVPFNTEVRLELLYDNMSKERYYQTTRKKNSYSSFLIPDKHLSNQVFRIETSIDTSGEEPILVIRAFCSRRDEK